MEIRGLTKLMEQLKNRADKAREDTRVSVTVGYTAAYA